MEAAFDAQPEVEQSKYVGHEKENSDADKARGCGCASLMFETCKDEDHFATSLRELAKKHMQDREHLKREQQAQAQQLEVQYQRDRHGMQMRQQNEYSDLLSKESTSVAEPSAPVHQQQPVS